MIILTAQERDRFRQWLLQDAFSNDQLASEIEKLPNMFKLEQRYRGISFSEKIVADILGKIEEQAVKVDTYEPKGDE